MRTKNNLPDFSAERILWKQGFRFVAGVDEVGRGAWAGPIVASAVVFPAGPATPHPHSTSSQSLRALNGGPPLRVTRRDVLIDDSKRLTVVQRELTAKWIRANCLAWGIGEVGPKVINKFGMAKATKMAFRKAIAECNQKLRVSVSRGSGSENGDGLRNTHNTPAPLNSQLITYPQIDFLLIDAFYIPYVNGVRRKNQLAIIDGDQKSISIAAASILAKVYRDKLMSSLSEQAKYKEYGWERNKGYGTKEHQMAILKHGVTGMHRKAFVATWMGKTR